MYWRYIEAMVVEISWTWSLEDAWILFSGMAVEELRLPSKLSIIPSRFVTLSFIFDIFSFMFDISPLSHLYLVATP